jgi:hypothetical protein
MNAEFLQLEIMKLEEKVKRYEGFERIYNNSGDKLRKKSLEPAMKRLKAEIDEDAHVLNITMDLMENE